MHAHQEEVDLRPISIRSALATMSVIIFVGMGSSANAQLSQEAAMLIIANEKTFQSSDPAYFEVDQHITKYDDSGSVLADYRNFAKVQTGNGFTFSETSRVADLKGVSTVPLTTFALTTPNWVMFREEYNQRAVTEPGVVECYAPNETVTAGTRGWQRSGIGHSAVFKGSSGFDGQLPLRDFFNEWVGKGGNVTVEHTETTEGRWVLLHATTPGTYNPRVEVAFSVAKGGCIIKSVDCYDREGRLTSERTVDHQLNGRNWVPLRDYTTTYRYSKDTGDVSVAQVTTNDVILRKLDAKLSLKNSDWFQKIGLQEGSVAARMGSTSDPNGQIPSLVVRGEELVSE